MSPRPLLDGSGPPPKTNFGKEQRRLAALSDRIAAMNTTAPTTSVMTRHARFDMSGQRLHDVLRDIDEMLSPGLVNRLHKFAFRRLMTAGFDVTGWSCEVYTLDGDWPPSNRAYTVEYTNASGGVLGVQGIYTERGWPSLDHGLFIAEGRTNG